MDRLGLFVQNFEIKDASPLLSSNMSEMDDDAKYFQAVALEKTGYPDNVSQAHQIYEELAKNDHPEASYRLATIAREKNEFFFVSKLRNAALLGHPQAMYELARVCEERKEYAAAADWFEAAKEKGHDLANIEFERMRADPQTAYAIGWDLCFPSAMGRHADLKKGIPWLDHAAHLGHEGALIELGDIYFIRSEDRSRFGGWEKKAISYYLRLTELSRNPSTLSKAFFRLALLHAKQLASLKNGTATERLALEQKVMEYFRIAGGYQSRDALRELGKIYEEGRYGVQPDDGMALTYYDQAAELGDSTALCVVGSMYTEGKVVTADISTAAQYYLKAAKLGDKLAAEPLKVIAQQFRDQGRFREAHECRIASTYLRKLSQKVESKLHFYQSAESTIAKISLRLSESERKGFYQSAIKEYTLASTVLPEALVQLAKLYKNGIKEVGVTLIEPNGAEALRHFQLAMECGGITPLEAYQEIAEIYLQGIGGIPKNEVIANHYFQLAAQEKGEASSENNFFDQSHAMYEPGGIFEL